MKGIGRGLIKPDIVMYKGDILPYWRPLKFGEKWICRLYVDEIKQTPPKKPDFMGPDGTPLRFNSEKAARIKCDSLNKKDGYGENITTFS